MERRSPFATLLVDQRKRRGWSRTQLSEQSGLSYPYISQLETAQRKPSRRAAYQLAAALGIDPTDLEGSIPADETDAREVERARSYSSQLMGIPEGIEVPGRSSADGAPRRARASGRATRADRLGDMLDLLEEFEPEERLEALAELQKLAMQRLLEERDRHRG